MAILHSHARFFGVGTFASLILVFAWNSFIYFSLPLTKNCFLGMALGSILGASLMILYAITKLKQKPKVQA